MQASFDICPTATDKSFSISFYDKFSSSDIERMKSEIEAKKAHLSELYTVASKINL